MKHLNAMSTKLKIHSASLRCAGGRNLKDRHKCWNEFNLEIDNNNSAYLLAKLTEITGFCFWEKKFDATWA